MEYKQLLEVAEAIIFSVSIPDNVLMTYKDIRTKLLGNQGAKPLSGHSHVALETLIKVSAEKDDLSEELDNLRKRNAELTKAKQASEAKLAHLRKKCKDKLSAAKATFKTAQAEGQKEQQAKFSAHIATVREQLHTRFQEQETQLETLRNDMQQVFSAVYPSFSRAQLSKAQGDSSSTDTKLVVEAIQQLSNENTLLRQQKTQLQVGFETLTLAHAQTQQQLARVQQSTQAALSEWSLTAGTFESLQERGELLLRSE
mmetsp:Transcript_35389/g.69413  ORF Transcript_35389/g.69413 Transcript_35389/m.69413 type:complete len:257 (+) Transcript_35389:3-773(+)